jgi:acetolactate synthase-1/2/3 large subunit
MLIRRRKIGLRIPWWGIMPVYDELYKFKDQLHHVFGTPRTRATHAAQGYARATGKVGVAIATSVLTTNW